MASWRMGGVEESSTVEAGGLLLLPANLLLAMGAWTGAVSPWVVCGEGLSEQ
jgi:hypothetical protein